MVWGFWGYLGLCFRGCLFCTNYECSVYKLQKLQYKAASPVISSSFSVQQSLFSFIVSISSFLSLSPFIPLSLCLSMSLCLPLSLPVTPWLYIDFCIADVPEPCSSGGAAKESQPKILVCLKHTEPMRAETLTVSRGGGTVTP